MVGAGGVNTVLVGYNLPKFSADLIAALACLNMDDFAHFIILNEKLQSMEYIMISCDNLIRF